MKHSQPQPDAIRKFQREEITARRAGTNTRCAWCGETRLEALVRGSKPTRCAECKRKMKGQTIMDKHHVAGRANSRVTVTIRANDHRAVLSVAQCDWPRQTLENPAGCPLLAAAGCIRGFIDTISPHLLFIQVPRSVFSCKRSTHRAVPRSFAETSSSIRWT